nr:SDR family NAD(P)-dependent oxidoreductase [uncultured Roseococcus sp.]
MPLTISPSLTILGLATRLPGAANLDELWSVLADRRSTIRNAPPVGRWRSERFLSPDRQARGMAYTFAGGYLADPFAFDAAAFGLSPREAAQMDPQQRLLLEVTWEAMEDAGLPPSKLRGQRVGVYIGASTTDYADVPLLDLGAIEPHFMVGNSLSILSNRISHIYDLRGPSLTIDTACSSSIVALAQAARALETGEIDLAVVGGVNIFTSPAPFIGFSRAGMLSPTGLCRPFSAHGDGYVRSEGAVALLLGRAGGIAGGYERPRAVLRAISVNSDGHTDGISLPSIEGQRHLLSTLYKDAGIAPDELAFVEAHGTGTRVGDPIEARAIGLALGRHRSTPLPIGSVKSNIGHLEAASGLAGLAKVVLALEHRLFPATLHLEAVNPDIDVEALGLRPAAEALALPENGRLLAGLCNYGFGGTNAHAILEAPTVPHAPSASAAAPDVLMISAHTREALRTLMADYARLGNDAGLPAVAVEAQHLRDRLRHRAVLDLTAPEEALRELTTPDARSDENRLIVAEAPAPKARTLFVFSGNGSQWPGMSRDAYATNAIFRETFDDLAARIRSMGGVCPLETMQSDDVAERLRRASAAQPLLFASQIALTHALRAAGLRPMAVLGHSVGEVAAAAVCGALDLDAAVHLIVQRSACQEAVRGMGGMAVLACDAQRAALILDEAGVDGVEIAARNGPSSTTLSGPTPVLEAVLSVARRARLPAVLLDIEYPFHHALLEREKEAIIGALQGLAPCEAEISFFSTVTGSELEGASLDAAYWYANVREPVLLEDALRTALPHTDLIIEIGPRPILTSGMADVVRSAGRAASVISSLTQEGNGSRDPVRRVILRAIAHGALLDEPDPSPFPGQRGLPRMRWNRRTFLMPRTPEAFDLYGVPFDGKPLHPLIGARISPAGPEWRHVLSLETLPLLRGHVVDGNVVFPATGFIEALLAVGREIHGTARLRIEDLDVLRALVFEPGTPREIATLWHEADRVVEIRSRRRFDPADSFTLHARGVVVMDTEVHTTSPPDLEGAASHSRAAVYAAALAARLDYTQAFRVVTAAWTQGALTVADLEPIPLDLGTFSDVLVIDLATFDASFHALFLGVSQEKGSTRGELPIRIGRMSLLRPDLPIRRTITRLRRETGGTRVFDAELLAANGATVAVVTGVVMRRVTYAAWTEGDRVLTLTAEPWAGRAAADVASFLEDLLEFPPDKPSQRVTQVAVGNLVVEMAAQVVRQVTGDAFTASGVAGRPGMTQAAQCAWYAIVELLQTANRLQPQGDQLRVIEDPSARDCWRDFLANYPEASTELRLARHASENLPALLAGTADGAHWNAQIGEAFLAHSVFSAPAVEAIVEAIEQLVAARPQHILTLGLLEPGLGILLPSLASLARSRRVQLLLLVADRSAAQDIATGLALRDLVVIPDPARGDVLRLDLVACLAVTPLNVGAPSPLGLLASFAMESPPLLVAAPGHDPILDVLHGAKPGWFDLSVSPDMPVGQWPLPSETEEALAIAGFAPTKTVPIGAAGGQLLLARSEDARPPVESAVASTDDLLLLVLSEASEAVIRAALPGQDLLLSKDAEATAREMARQHRLGRRPMVLDMAEVAADGSRPLLQARILRLRALLLALGHETPFPARLYVTVQAETAHGEAIAGFTRCLMNEFPNIGIYLIRVAGDASPQALSTALLAHGTSPGIERELEVSAQGAFVRRATRAAPAVLRSRASGERNVLAAAGGELEQFTWTMQRRPTPADDEVEVEVVASGLNFRDVMLGLGLLDDEILGEGLTIGSRGFEFAGRVSTVGRSVTSWHPGDRVMGFGGGAFASHLCVPASSLTRVPSSLSLEAAASIPVAFVTAWYSLVDKAQLVPGETLLVHGAAGAVGIAAVQIAKRRGARVVALAGTAEKRDLLRLLGADIVLDSRSANWAQEVRSATSGVDVVLNSVSGEAARATLGLLRPFGRFIELGKRDFLENSRLGTRPFVRNLSYIGVDIDQLLVHAPATVQAVIQQVMEAFEDGRLHPPPSVAYDGRDIASAMRLMQASKHIGKILIRPAARARALEMPAGSFLPREGAHVVIGGTGGFALATAIWLAERGAGTVIVASRRGEIEPAQADRVADLQARGVRFLVERLDATDSDGVMRAFTRWRTEHRSIAGVVHAAMVLDDGLVSGLNEERLAAVLAPKVDGMRALTAALHDDALQYLVVYSSATTLVGSPGQSAYVAANGFLEGAVAELRSRGVPAFAVCWGAISDVGVIQRKAGLAERLRQTTGMKGVSSSEALGYLGELLADPASAPVVSAYTALHWSPAARKLATLNSPLFAEVFGRDSNATDGEAEGTLDLAGLSPEDAAAALCAAVSEEVARVLRLQVTEIDPDRPLIEAGLDSLLTLELRLGLERRIGFELPMLSLGGDRSARQTADRILTALSSHATAMAEAE